MCQKSQALQKTSQICRLSSPLGCNGRVGGLRRCTVESSTRGSIAILRLAFTREAAAGSLRSSQKRGDQRMDNSDRVNLRKHQIQRSPVHPAQNNIIILIVISSIRGVYAAAAHIAACLQQLELASFCTLVHIFKRIQSLETCTGIMERRGRIPYNLL